MHQHRIRFAPLSAGALALTVLVALPACKSSGDHAANQGIGAAVSTNTSVGAAERGAARANDRDPGYARYLARLGSRRTARGLPAPAELRVAMRRQRYKSVVEMLEHVGSVAQTAVDPIVSAVPHVAAAAVTKTASPDPFSRPMAARDAATVLHQSLFRSDAIRSSSKQ